MSVNAEEQAVEMTVSQRDFRSKHGLDWNVHVRLPYPGEKDPRPYCEMWAGGAHIGGPLETVRHYVGDINDALAEIERLSSFPLEDKSIQPPQEERK